MVWVSESRCLGIRHQLHYATLQITWYLSIVDRFSDWISVYHFQPYKFYYQKTYWHILILIHCLCSPRRYQFWWGPKLHWLHLHHSYNLGEFNINCHQLIRHLNNIRYNDQEKYWGLQNNIIKKPCLQNSKISHDWSLQKPCHLIEWLHENLLFITWFSQSKKDEIVTLNLCFLQYRKRSCKDFV